MRAVENNLPTPSWKVEESEGPQWTRARQNGPGVAPKQVQYPGILCHMTFPPEFREALKSFSVMAIEEIQHRIGQGARIYTRTVQVPVRLNPTTWNSEEREYPVWGMLLFESRDKLSDSPEYRKCEQFMREIPVVARHLDELIWFGYGGGRFDVNNCLHGFIAHQLEGKTVLDFQEGRFGESYDDLQTFFVKDEIEYETWVPVENLQCPETPVSITPTITVLRTPTELFETIFRIEETLYQFDQVMKWESVLHLKWTGLKIIGGSPEKDEFKDVNKIAEELLTALRLLKAERVRAGPIATRPKRWTPMLPGVSYTSPLGSGLPFRPPQYVLAASDGDGVRKILEQLAALNADKFRSLALALRRFNLSYDRHHPEDRLIDQMIAFEALYLSGDDRAEKSFRLALRSSYFLEAGAQRKDVYRDMKCAYNLRSAIVHGGTASLPTINGTQMSMSNFADKIEEYLRRTLSKFLDLSQQPGATPILVRWDDLLFPDTSARS